MLFEVTSSEFWYYAFLVIFLLICYFSYVPHLLALFYTRYYLYQRGFCRSQTVFSSLLTSSSSSGVSSSSSSASRSKHRAKLTPDAEPLLRSPNHHHHPHHHHHQHQHHHHHHNNNSIHPHHNNNNNNNNINGSVFFSSSSSSSHDLTYPGVSIIKPLLGMDPHLRENLLSFFTQDYPLFQLLFCVATPHDPVCVLVTKLMQEHPHVDAQLLTSAHQCGVNHKINNMNQGYEKAKYDFILISDSGIFMRKHTLLDMVMVIQSKDTVAMVHQVPYLKPYNEETAAVAAAAAGGGAVVGGEANMFCRRYQQVYFGSWHARNYMGAACLGVSCTTGMSCLIRKPILDQAGGLRAFAGYLAEDFFMSKYMFDHKHGVLLAHEPAWQNAAAGSIEQFHQRIQRWYRMRLMMVPFAALFEPFSDCFLMNGIIATVWYLLWPSRVHIVWMFLGHSLVWFASDYTLLKLMHPPGEPLGGTLCQYARAWLYREALSLSLQVRGMLNPNITWRNKVYRLSFGGRAEDITPSQEGYFLGSSSSPDSGGDSGGGGGGGGVMITQPMQQQQQAGTTTVRS